MKRIVARGEHIERRKQHAHEGGLGRGRSGRLHDVVFPAIVVLEGDAQREIAEERRHDRDVRAEAEFSTTYG